MKIYAALRATARASFRLVAPYLQCQDALLLGDHVGGVEHVLVVHRVLPPSTHLTLQLRLGLEDIEGVAEHPCPDGRTGTQHELH